MREKSIPRQIHVTKGLRVRIANLLVRLDGQRLGWREREVDITRNQSEKEIGAHTYLRILWGFLPAWDVLPIGAT